MLKLNKITKIVGVAIIGVILIIVAVLYGGTQPSNNPIVSSSAGPDDAMVTATSPNQTLQTSPSSSQPATAPEAHANNTTTTPSKPQSPAPRMITVSIITPVANDIWTIGSQNEISWKGEAGVTGSISLLDATTKQFIGVILPQVGMQQTYYVWNTRDIYFNRSSADKKDVLPGTYVIEVSFDGNNLAPITSPAFSITN